MRASLKKFFKFFAILLIALIALIVIGFVSLHFFGKKMMKDAEKKRIQVESFKSNNYNDYISYSIPYSKAGDFATSFVYINKAVEMNPIVNLGYRIHIKIRFLRDYDGALDDMKTVDSLTSGFQYAAWGEDIDFLKGECYFGKKEYQKAINHFKKSIDALGVDGVDIHAFVLIGISEYKLNNKQKAISYFKKALEQSNVTPEAYFWLAKIYFEENQLQKAAENISLAVTHFKYKRTDPYTEFLNEIYFSEVETLKDLIQNTNHSTSTPP